MKKYRKSSILGKPTLFWCSAKSKPHCSNMHDNGYIDNERLLEQLDK